MRVHSENLDRQKLPEEAKGKDVWDRRYREINDWERYLTDNGFKVVKLFLNLSKEEQRTRFFKRLDLPEKNWKLSAADVRERQHWDDYQEAFSEMLSATSTHWAPWYVIPADRKWFARICAGAVLAHTLIEIDPQYPEVTVDRRQQLLAVKGELEAEAPKGTPSDPFAAKQAKAEAKRAKADSQQAEGRSQASEGRSQASQGASQQAERKPELRRRTRPRPQAARSTGTCASHSRLGARISGRRQHHGPAGLGSRASRARACPDRRHRHGGAS